MAASRWCFPPIARDDFVRIIELSDFKLSETLVVNIHYFYGVSHGSALRSKISNKSELSESEKSVGDVNRFQRPAATSGARFRECIELAARAPAKYSVA